MADGNGSGEAAQRHLRKDTGRQAGANGRCAPTSWRKLRVLDLAGGGSQIEGAAERMIDLMIGRMIGLMIGGLEGREITIALRSEATGRRSTLANPSSASAMAAMRTAATTEEKQVADAIIAAAVTAP